MAITAQTLIKHIPLQGDVRIEKSGANLKPLPAKTIKRFFLTGFTLIELLFVIIIIGILIGVSLPRLKESYNGIQLNNFSRELQDLMNYLRQRAIVERTVISLNFDPDKDEYWAMKKGAETRLKTYHIPGGIKLETDKTEIFFYPDGQIDKVTVEIINPAKQNITLTTKGIFGGAKILKEK